MDYTEVFKSIIDNFGGVGVVIVGLLIICIIGLPVGIPLLLNKKTKDISNTLSNGIVDIGNTLTATLKEQNESQKEILLRIVDKLPDVNQAKREHDNGQEQRFDIGNDINKLLLIMLGKYHASRACVLEFHNGGSNIGGLPFIKYNMEYEQIKQDVRILGGIVRDLPSSNIAPIISDLTDGSTKYKVYNHDDIEELKLKSTVLYSHLQEINVERIIYGPLYNSANIMIGLCVLEYGHDDNSIISSEDIFNKFIENNKLEIHDDMIKIANYLDLKNK